MPFRQVQFVSPTVQFNWTFYFSLLLLWTMNECCNFVVGNVSHCISYAVISTNVFHLTVCIYSHFWEVPKGCVESQ